MDKPKPTGDLRWVRESDWWALEEAVLCDLPGSIGFWATTDWWIYRFAPFWPFPYEVLHNDCEVNETPKPIKSFWTLRKAKAFVEVMHRMGVRYG